MMYTGFHYRVITIAFDLPMLLDTEGAEPPATLERSEIEQAMKDLVLREVQRMHPECLVRSVEVLSFDGPQEEGGQLVFRSKGEVIIWAPESSPLFRGDELAMTA